MIQSKTYGYFKSPVGGIIYKPLEKRDEDIYGEEITLDNLLSYRHAPVQVNEPVRGYQRGQYKWTLSEESEKEAEKTKEQTDVENLPQTRLIIPTSEGVIQQTQDVLNGKEDFKKLENLYSSALQKRGIDVKYAKWLAAQDALESGWGISQGSRRHNYGNIITGSSWTGDSFVGDDHDAQNKPITQRFRAYDSVEDYVEDKLDLLQSNRYKNAFTGDVDKFIDRIFTSGYAVDPKYVQKVKSVYNNWG